MLKYQKLNQLIKPYKMSINADEAFVTLDEEFGFKQYVWKPEMSCKEFERWWLRQHSITYNKFLPGKIIDINKIREQLPLKEYDSLNDEIFFYLPFERWYTIDKSNLCYHAMIFDDDYSYLKTPSGRYIHHMGWWPARLQTEINIKEQLDITPGERLRKDFEEIGCKFAGKGFRV